MDTFTVEQEAALKAFDEACSSHDLHAYGRGRKFRAHECVVHWFGMVERLGIANALTDAELAQVRSSRAFIS